MLIYNWVNVENLFRINEEYDEIKISRVCILYVYRMYGYF